MFHSEFQIELMRRLEEVHRLCPEFRVGQLMATLGMLGEDATGRTLWDIEDDDLAAAIDRLAKDLARRAND